MLSGRAAIVTRQIKLDRRSTPQLAVDGDVAVGLPGKSVDHRKPEPGALPDRLGGEERIEGARRHLRTHADAGVADSDANIIAGRKRGVSAVTLPRCAFTGEMVSLPPSGMASRALMARLSSALSS